MDRTHAEELEISPEDIEVIRKVYKSVFGRDADLKYDEKCVDVVEIEGIAALAYGEIEVEQVSILTNKKRREKRWFVEKIKYYPQTRHEPEDIDYIPVADFGRLDDAISSAFGLVVQRFVNFEFEAEYCRHCAEEEEVETL